MKEQIISFETANLAKEKRFDWSVYQLYRRGELFVNNGYLFDWNSQNNIDFVSAPTQSLLARWLREVHNLHISVLSQSNNKNDWGWEVMHVVMSELNNIHMESKDEDHYITYEEAFEDALKKTLKLISNGI